MFKNKKEIFSFRKYKAYGLASAVIASMFLAQGVVSADVVTTPDGTRTTLSNDKASVTVDANHFKDSNDKTAKELYDAKEYEADKVTTGKDTVKGEYKTVVSYETEDGTKLKEDVTKTSTEDKELDYKVEGTSGKEYTGASTSASEVNADLEKQNTIEKDGETYKYVRTETTQGKETVLTETHFNDVETKASVEGMYNNDGSIKYDKIKDGSRVWVLEEKEDGTYGNYALIENAQGLSDEKIREAAKTATTKFSKAEVEKLGGIKETDSIVVYETNTYAARKQTSEQVGKDFYYEHTANSSNFYKSYIDDIYKVGLEGLEKQGDRYVYKGQEVPTIEDFKTKYVARTDGSEGLGEYPTDELNRYYIKSSGMYAVPTTYYDVLSDFLIAHPDSPIFAGKAKEVFWGDGEEEYYFNFAFVARLLNNSFKSKYNLNIDTQNFSNKPLDSKAKGSRPTEKTTYSFVRTDLKGDVDTFDQSHYGDQNDLWKHEIGSSYSSENVEKVRRWVKGYKSMNGESASDVFNDKPTSEITQQEYIEAVFNNVFNFYLSTFKDQLEPEQIKELRAKFGDSVFNVVGNSVGADIDNPETYVVNGGGSHIFRNSLGVVTENTETFSYHDVVTPLRAYRLTASNNLVRHIYEQVNNQANRGSVIATHKDTKGKELAPAEKIVTDVPDGESYTTNEKSFPNKSVIERQPDGSVRIRITEYRLTKTPENKNGRVKGGSVITVPYVYEEVEIANIENKPAVKRGSVIATYKDTDGNELSPQETIKSNTPSGEDYTTTAKSFDPIVTTDTVDGLTRKTTTTYELVETPANANGKVKGGETITVPYVYRKVVNQEINGSVIVTHHDENGVQLAPDEKIKDNVKAGEPYTTHQKQFDEAVITARPNGLTQKIHSYYELVSTPSNAKGAVEGGKTTVVPYIYRKVASITMNGSVIVTHKDTEGNELVPTEQIVTDVPDGTSYTTSSKEIPSKVVTDETPEGFTRTTTTTYELVENPANKDGQVKGGSVITVPYVYKKVVNQEINGSVIVTHYDEDGNQLAPDEKIKDNAKSGEHYTSSPKHFDSTNITANANGLTQRIYSGYELVRTPANNSGEVEGGKTIIVPYVYRKVSSIILHGSVIATHKDTEGHELAPAEQIKTNVPGGESYSTNEKSFPNQSVVERRPDGSVRIQVIGYKLVKTPENKDGKVKGGSVITVPYVYEKVVIANIENKPVDKPKSEIPKDAPKVDIEAVKLTRFMLEDRKTEIKPHVEGFVEPIEKIGNYAYTRVTDSDEGGAVITHIYKSVKAFELPKDAPVHDKPEYNGGAVPNEAPVHDKPEYNGGAVPNDAPVHDKPEFNGGVIPNDAPVHDKPEFNGGVIPNDAPVHDKPEYNGGAVPNDAPVHDKPEFNGDAVPNEAPVHDKPEFNGNVSRIDSTAHSKPELKIPAQSVETPVAEVEKPSQPAAQKPQEKYATKELPNTGSEASVLGLVGLATAIGSIGLLKFKKDDSE